MSPAHPGFTIGKIRYYTPSSSLKVVPHDGKSSFANSKKLIIWKLVNFGEINLVRTVYIVLYMTEIFIGVITIRKITAILGTIVCKCLISNNSYSSEIKNTFVYKHQPSNMKNEHHSLYIGIYRYLDLYPANDRRRLRSYGYIAGVVLPKAIIISCNRYPQNQIRWYKEQKKFSNMYVIERKTIARGCHKINQ